MNKTIVKLIGIEVFTSKKGVTCVIIHCLAPLNKRETHSVCTGNKAVSFFVSDKLQSKIDASDVGKEITIYTYFSNGKDNLAEIVK